MDTNELAKLVLELHAQVTKLQEELDTKKDELREIADGKKLNIVVDGVGKINISEPRRGSEKVVLKIDEDVLSKVVGLKESLVKKGVVKEEIKITAPAKASVSISCNV